MKRCLLVVGFMMYLCQSAQAGEVVVALTGAKGTMKEFHDQISKVCSQPALVERQSPNGSVGVLNDLLNNEATVGFVLEDVLFARKMVENDPDVDNLKTLVNLYPSEVHIVTLANSPVRLFTDLGNKRLGVVGGAAKTCQILAARTGIRYSQILIANTEDQLVQMLDKGQVDVIMGIGGQPLKWVKGLSSKFRLVEFNAFDKVNDIYLNATLNTYPNLGSGVRGIATNTLIVTYNYTSGGKVADLNEYKGCITRNLTNLKETTGNHKKWREVRAGSKAKWPMYGKTASAKKTTKK